MGYDVYYSGEIEITPALTTEDRILLQKIVDAAERYNAADGEEAVAILNKIQDEFCPCYSFPMLLCEDKDELETLDEEEREGLSRWLAGFIKYFFQPRGYSLEGSVTYSGECSGDHGEIYVKDNEVESVEDVEVNEGPSWAPTPYVSEIVRKAIERVVDSADSTGCDGDLTVCFKSAVETLAAVVRSETTGAAMPDTPEANPQPSELSEQYDEPGKWGQHPILTMALWQEDVLTSGTRRGYWDWVAYKLEDESAEKRRLASLACSTSPAGA